ncbi:MAG TPA: leucine-rich repeat domain-containing protein, partial [Gemmata sp.]
GVDLPDELRRARLTEAYVTLNLEPETDADAEDDETGTTLVSTEAAFDTLLPQTGRLLIRGSAGGGKTTLMKWAAINAARMALPDAQWRAHLEYEGEPDSPRLRTENEKDAISADWRHRMPFIVFLRNCQDGLLPPPKAFPALVARTLGDPPPNWVESTLRAGRGLVLLDGVDEIPHANRGDLRNSVEALIGAFPKSYFVLTTRPEAVDPDWLTDLKFQEVHVVPMSEGDRDKFIQQWYEAVSRGKNAPELKAQAAELVRDLETAPWLTPLVTNPMLCAMTCALYHARRGFLPDGLRQMCEVLCEMMLHRLDQERKIDLSKFPHPYPLLKYEQKKAVMRQLAYHFVLNDRSALAVPDARAQVGLALGRMPDRRSEEATAVFDCIRERSGMIREATPEDETTGKPATIEFLHNTFKEFLAGEQIATERHAPLLLQRLHHEAWRRVGVFAFAAGDVVFQNEILNGVFERLPPQLPKPRSGKQKAAPAVEQARALAVFALQCRGQATHCSEEVKQRLNSLVVQLIPPRNFTDAAWLAAAGNVAVPHLKYERRLANVQAACVRALRLIGTPEALNALAGYGIDDRKGVLHELGDSVPLMSRNVREIDYLGRSDIRRISHLSGLTGLAYLYLNSTGVTDLSPLSGLTGLAYLYLSSTGVTDLSPLSGLTGLRELYLISTGVTDLSPLSGLTGLTRLNLNSTGVTDLSPLSGLTGLTRLNLNSTGVTDLSPLSGLTGLTELYLNNTSVTDLSPLSKLTGLRNLYLNSTGVTDLSPLAKRSGLMLHLANVKADRSCVKHLTIYDW